LRNVGRVDPQKIDDHPARRLRGGGQGVDRNGTRRDRRGSQGERAARPRRGRLPGRTQVGDLQAEPRKRPLPHLQRRRGRPGSVHGPRSARRRPAQCSRGHDHLCLCHRGHQGLHLRAGRPALSCAAKRLQ
jgi:hypothetical protein